MPRKARRPNPSDVHSNRTAPNEHAISARIQSTFKKILLALQDQRDLRCDLARTRTRALLLDSEYVVLHTEYDRSIAARDRLEALSRELTRQNRIIDDDSEKRILEEKKMREEIIQRFNVAMIDINKKLARQNSTREQRDRYVQTLQNKLADLQERYNMREQHFKQQVRRRQLEKQLAVAKHRELVKKYASTAEQLATLQRDLNNAEQHDHVLAARLQECKTTITNCAQYLESTQEHFETQKAQIEKLQLDAKQLQAANASARNANNSTNVHIKAMESEFKRLEASIAESREVERRERSKIDALEKLYKQVTIERTELHSEILVMQDAWSNLKQEIETLKDQVGETGKVFEVLQSIMNRESLDVAVSAFFRNDRSIEDVISDELSRVHLVSGTKLDEQLSISATAAKSSPANAIRPPG